MFHESSEAAVLREAFEETGVTFEIDRLAYVQERFFKLSGEYFHEITFFYLLKSVSGAGILENRFTDQPEIETLHWLPLESLSEFDIVPEFLKTAFDTPFESVRHIISKEY